LRLAIYAEFASYLTERARAFFQGEELAVRLENSISALGLTTIDLCLALFAWARFRKTEGAVKIHTLLDLGGSIPALITISTGKVHYVNLLDLLPLKTESIF
jgi:hypothetical protein